MVWVVSKTVKKILKSARYYSNPIPKRTQWWRGGTNISLPNSISARAMVTMCYFELHF